MTSVGSIQPFALRFASVNDSSRGGPVVIKGSHPQGNDGNRGGPVVIKGSHPQGNDGNRGGPVNKHTPSPDGSRKT